MEKRPDRFTAFLDANALVPVLQRDLILSLGEAGFYRPRWSARVLDEFEAAFLKVVKGATPEIAANQRASMEQAFDEASVIGYERLIPIFTNGPDADDAHVMAAAQRCGAEVIVTNNVRDFPAELLRPFDMHAATPDEFIADALDLDQEVGVATVRQMRLRYGKDGRAALSPATLIEKLRGLGLHQTADILAHNLEGLT